MYSATTSNYCIIFNYYMTTNLHIICQNYIILPMSGIKLTIEVIAKDVSIVAFRMELHSNVTNVMNGFLQKLFVHINVAINQRILVYVLAVWIQDNVLHVTNTNMKKTSLQVSGCTLGIETASILVEANVESALNVQKEVNGIVKVASRRNLK